MSWNPTNANDVTLIISVVERDESGTRTGTVELANTNAVVVDDFSIDTDEDLEGLSGIGNRTPQGITLGNIEHQFSFTVQGEDADLFADVAENTGNSQATSANELEIIAQFENTKIELSGAFAGTRNVSGSSGDAIEYEAEGMATDKRVLA